VLISFCFDLAELIVIIHHLLGDVWKGNRLEISAFPLLLIFVFVIRSRVNLVEIFFELGVRSRDLGLWI
jgi:hypothetical protein